MHAPPEDSGPFLGIAAAAVAVSAWGLAGVVAKAIDMGGIAIGAYRFTLYGLVVAGLFGLRGSPLTVRVMRVSMWGGLALALDVAFFFSAIKLTTVANATVIGALQPVVVSVAAWRLFGERVARRDVGLALVAIGGVAVVVFGGGDTADGDRLGDALAVGALFSWSAYFIFSKRTKAQISSNEFTIGAALWTGLLNAPLAAIFGQSLAWPSLESWVGLIVLAFGAGALGHSLMNWSIQQIPLWISSTFTLLIPVVSATAAWFFLDEPLSGIQVAAMFVVLGALGAIVANRSGIGSRPRPLRR